MESPIKKMEDAWGYSSRFGNLMKALDSTGVPKVVAFTLTSWRPSLRANSALCSAPPMAMSGYVTWRILEEERGTKATDAVHVL